MNGIVSKPKAVGAKRSTPGPNLCFIIEVLHNAVADLATALIVKPRRYKYNQQLSHNTCIIHNAPGIITLASICHIRTSPALIATFL